VSSRQKALDLLKTCGKAVLVTVVRVEGSAPREEGAWMMVTPHGILGTIGGGALEWRACALAEEMLQSSELRRLDSYALGPDLGQCCGGRIVLESQVVSDRATKVLDAMQVRSGAYEPHQFLLFGAGHVGQALVRVLTPTGLRIHWVDPRPAAFSGGWPASVTMSSDPNFLTALATCSPGACTWVMTHSHALDLAITEAALRVSNMSKVGVIGSATKRARFVQRLRKMGITEVQLEKFICPIGLPGIKSKEPAAIAISAAAQILQILESVANQRVPDDVYLEEALA
jgi:xanthine dehydrogenase accessory factor